MQLKRRSPKDNAKAISKTMDEVRKEKSHMVYLPLDTTKVVSTGSTLLDLAISGGRIRGGGIPGGVMAELSGPSGAGKTAVLVETGTSVQSKGGDVRINDPEGRLDKEYSALYGLKLEDEEDYERSDLVKDVFDDIRKWNPKRTDVINLYGCDSIAALTTDLEMSEEGDKRGQKKAKDISSGCRVVGRIIAHEHKLVIFTNHEKDAEYGKTTPGGKSVGFHASLRIRIYPKKKLYAEKTLESGAKVEQQIGLLSEAEIFKSSIDNVGRTAPLYIMPGLGIDDVRANLQWYKDMMKINTYHCVDCDYKTMSAAIRHIEENNLESDLRDLVIDLWEDIQMKFKVERKKKVRF